MRKSGHQNSTFIRMLYLIIVGLVLLATESGCTPAMTTPNGMWKFIPLKVTTQDLGGGWQKLSVQMAMENNTARAGSITFPDVATVTTAEGYAYQADKGFDGVPNWFSVIPTGFRLRGNETGDFVLTFRVAQNTHGYKISIPYTITPAGTRNLETAGPAIIDLDKDVRQLTFPTDLPSTGFKSLGDPFTVPGKGTITIDKLDNCKKGEKDVCVWATYRNSSGGYDQTFEVKCHALDDAGISHDSTLGWATFYAGPNQTVQNIITSFHVGGDRGLRAKSNLKLICWNVSDVAMGAAVFNIDY